MLRGQIGLSCKHKKNCKHVLKDRVVKISKLFVKRNLFVIYTVYVELSTMFKDVLYARNINELKLKFKFIPIKFKLRNTVLHLRYTDVYRLAFNLLFMTTSNNDQKC